MFAQDHARYSDIMVESLTLAALAYHIDATTFHRD